MSAGASIWIGDLIRAWTLIGAGTSEERDAIAVLLGFEAATVRDDWPREHGIPPAIPPAVADEKPRARTRDPDRASQVDSDTGIVRLTPVEGARRPKTDWLEGRRSLPAPAGTTVRGAAPEIAPLFEPAWTRGILREAVAMRLPTDEPDLDALLERIALAEPVERLPLLRTKSLRRGVQVLVDRSDGMLPYRDDQLWLVRQTRRMLGADQVQIVNFTGTPLRGAVSGSSGVTEPYQPPPAGVPVLLLGDLGIAAASSLAERATDGEWLEFADLLAEAGCPLVAFVPYPVHRWPVRLRGRLAMVQWDRGVTAGKVTAFRSLDGGAAR